MRAWLATVGVLLIAACSDQGPPTPSRLQPGADVPSSAVVGSTVTPSVTVTDDRGQPMAGVTVTWSVAAGGGSVAAATTVSDAAGVASPGAWTLGTTAGPNQIVVQSSGIRPLTLTVTGTAAPPDAIAALTGNPLAGTPGQLVTPGVRILDNYGNPVPGAQVRFTASQGSVAGELAVTGEDGVARPGAWSLANVAGLQSLLVRHGGLTARIDIFVDGMGGFAGDGSTCSSSASGCLFAVSIVDAAGGGASGESIEWRSTGGALLGTTTTDLRGFSRFVLANPSASGTVTARRVSTGQQIPFSYTVVTGGQFDIVQRFSGTASPSQRAIFQAAAARWEQVITGDLSNTSATGIAANTLCGGQVQHPAINEVVDDLLMYIEILPQDGVGGVLGAAGPCLVRDSNGLPVVGVIKLDAADVANLEMNGTLYNVVLHEMGHVLGIGLSPWQTRGLVTDLNSVNSRYTGMRAYPGFVLAGGPEGNGVPLENCRLPNLQPRTGCGIGTQDTHWHESVLGNELMTGYIGQGAAPLSTITIGALMDMGYQVDFSAADAYSLGTAALRLDGSDDRLPLRESPLPLPKRLPGG